mmetsp:Transcript_21226/g.42181  ORF Transcript_21226/g.42181 Transcript_21226/m.42181 type:complete len:112 (-) Transcript_21226:60-395(-)
MWLPAASYGFCSFSMKLCLKPSPYVHRPCEHPVSVSLISARPFSDWFPGFFTETPNNKALCHKNCAPNVEHIHSGYVGYSGGKEETATQSCRDARLLEVYIEAPTGQVTTH